MEAPRERGGRYFFLRRAADQDQFVLYMRNGRDGRDEVLLDPNPLSPDHSTSVALGDVSRDGNLIVYEIRHGGEDEVVPTIMDVTTRTVLPDRLPRARYAISLEPNKKGFYYSNLDASGSRLRYHAFGTDPKDDPELMASRSASEFLAPEVSLSGRYLVIAREIGSASDNVDLFVKDLSDNGPIRPIVEGVHARFDPVLAGDALYVVTNWNAPRNRVYRVDLARPVRENWKEVVAQSDYPLERVFAVGGHLALNYLKNVTTDIRIVDADGKPVRSVAMPQLGTAIGPFGRWDSSEAFYQFTTFTENRIIYRYDIDNGKQDVWGRVKTPIESSQVETKQVWYESRDRDARTHVPRLSQGHCARRVASGGAHRLRRIQCFQ